MGPITGTPMFKTFLSLLDLKPRPTQHHVVNWVITLLRGCEYDLEGQC